MGLDIIQEQIDVEDEIIDEPVKKFPFINGIVMDLPLQKNLKIKI